MATLRELMSGGTQAKAHRPWPRVTVDAKTWVAAAESLAAGELTLVGLFGDGTDVHMALNEGDADFAIITLACPDGRFPSVSRLHSPAIRLERTIRDLFGLEPEGALDARPWLDHGRWDVEYPLGAATPSDASGTAYAFLQNEGESLHQIPVGPVHAGIIEPGHFRFTASGEAVVRLEERLGYVHKGIESLIAGADLDRARKLAGRASGDSTVAYSLAFARAAEAALEIEAPPRAHYLRALMAELERLANHFGDIGAICNDATFTMMHAQCGVLRERVLRAAEAAFGHRLMMDRILPGGVAGDLSPESARMLRALAGEMRKTFPKLIELYDNTASLQDRTVGTGKLSAALAFQFGAGGYVGRASGRSYDARQMPGYPPYDALEFVLPVQRDGDVNSRVWVRIREVEQSLSLIETMLDRLPEGPIAVPVEPRTGEPREGAALVEGFRGDVLAWLRLGPDGRVARCHLRDPSWFHWPLLEAVIEGNIVADFPLCNKSFNCSYSGHDL